MLLFMRQNNILVKLTGLTRFISLFYLVLYITHLFCNNHAKLSNLTNLFINEVVVFVCVLLKSQKIKYILS